MAAVDIFGDLRVVDQLNVLLYFCRSLFADRGMRHALSFSVVPPVSNVRYWLASYEFSGFLPIWRRWVLTEAIQSELGVDDLV